MQKNNKPKHCLRALIPAHHHIFHYKQVHLRTQKTIERFGGGVYNRFVLVYAVVGVITHHSWFMMLFFRTNPLGFFIYFLP